MSAPYLQVFAWALIRALLLSSLFVFPVRSQYVSLFLEVLYFVEEVVVMVEVKAVLASLAS
jgi:hypothetical protein